MSAASRVTLHQLAHLYSVQTAYYDMRHRRQTASPEALLAVLCALGAPVDNSRDLSPALRARQQALWQRQLEPVVVQWEGSPRQVKVRLPARAVAVAGHLKSEDGNELSLGWRAHELPIIESAEIEGTEYVARALSLPELPPGYHHLAIDAGGKSAEALVIKAPRRAYPLSQGFGRRGWGVFLPLYALRQDKGFGTGDFGALAGLMTWVSGLGGSMVATLPLLAAFHETPYSPSPYAPVSRLMWNEVYVDIAAVPEMAECRAAQDMLASFQADMAKAKQSAFVDYRRLMVSKRRVLEALCQYCFASSPGRQAELERFAEAKPVVADYARFRAATEKQGSTWRSWPEPQRSGSPGNEDYDEARRRYHLYVQWLADQQVAELAERARRGKAGLCLDLPLGVHPDGYDAWRWQDVFVPGVSVGVPPDVVFTRGQDWGFAPLHPERLRQQGYSYFIACLRHHLRRARALRIDHIMGFHHLFWIPEGMPASQGVFVRYPAEEFYAILALESQRHQAVIVGEDLGTVPTEVRRLMSRCGIQRSFVLQLEADPAKALRRVPQNAVASLNTHDMSPFAAFWRGQDIRTLEETGLFDAARAREELAVRRSLKNAFVKFLKQAGWLRAGAASVKDVMWATLAALSASRAGIVLVNLEDLWQEVALQNLPGTVDDRNWSRQTRYSFEAFSQLPEVVETLKEIDHIRKATVSVTKRQSTA